MTTRRSAPALVSAIVWAMAALFGCIALPGAAAASPARVVQVDDRFPQVGQLIHITGSGWSPVGETVEIQLCGQDARNLSSDCDLANQYSAAIRPGGIFYGALTVRLPPTPCPCVVLVTSQDSFSGVDVPITIFGAPSSPVPAQGAQRVPVALSAQLQTPRSVSAWFGGPKTMTLVLHVTNLSPIDYESPSLTVNVGKGPDPSGFVVGRPLAPLGAGMTRVFRIPVTIPAFTSGDYTVRAQVITGMGSVATTVGTTTYPWGLFLVGLVILLIAGLVLWRRFRRRRQDRQLLLGPDDEPGAGDTAPVDATPVEGEVLRT